MTNDVHHWQNDILTMRLVMHNGLPISRIQCTIAFCSNKWWLQIISNQMKFTKCITSVQVSWIILCPADATQATSPYMIYLTHSTDSLQGHAKLNQFVERMYTNITSYHTQEVKSIWYIIQILGIQSYTKWCTWLLS